MPSQQSPTRTELEILVMLAALGQLPGGMLKTEMLAKKWLGPLPGREPADLARHLQSLLQKELLRENASKTTVGFTAAGYAFASSA